MNVVFYKVEHSLQKTHPEDNSSGEVAAHLHFPFWRYDHELHKDLLYKSHKILYKTELPLLLKWWGNYFQTLITGNVIICNDFKKCGLWLSNLLCYYFAWNDFLNGEFMGKYTRVQCIPVEEFLNRLNYFSTGLKVSSAGRHWKVGNFLK